VVVGYRHALGDPFALRAANSLVKYEPSWGGIIFSTVSLLGRGVNASIVGFHRIREGETSHSRRK
jgi:hypothetical protein